MNRFLGFFTATVLLIAALLILPIHGESGIYDNVIRLHVLAASDSEQDQANKLTVRAAAALCSAQKRKLKNLTTARATALS